MQRLRNRLRLRHQLRFLKTLQPKNRNSPQRRSKEKLAIASPRERNL
jgi:hypothetical protein